MMYAIVNVIGILLIVFILLWFFVLKSKKAAEATEQGLTVKVNGGVYVPGRIQLKLNQPTTLTFIREDSSECAATVIFDGMNTSVEPTPGLSIQKVSLALTPAQSSARKSTSLG